MLLRLGLDLTTFATNRDHAELPVKNRKIRGGTTQGHDKYIGSNNRTAQAIII